MEIVKELDQDEKDNYVCEVMYCGNDADYRVVGWGCCTHEYDEGYICKGCYEEEMEQCKSFVHTIKSVSLKIAVMLRSIASMICVGSISRTHVLLVNLLRRF